MGDREGNGEAQAGRRVGQKEQEWKANKKRRRNEVSEGNGEGVDERYMFWLGGKVQVRQREEPRLHLAPSSSWLDARQ